MIRPRLPAAPTIPLHKALLRFGGNSTRAPHSGWTVGKVGQDRILAGAALTVASAFLILRTARTDDLAQQVDRQLTDGDSRPASLLIAPMHSFGVVDA